MSEERDNRYLAAEDAKKGKQVSYQGIAIEIVEVHHLKYKLMPEQFQIAYRLHDNRQSPPFISGTAHIWLTKRSNVIEEFDVIKRHYDENKSMLKVKST